MARPRSIQPIRHERCQINVRHEDALLVRPEERAEYGSEQLGTVGSLVLTRARLMSAAIAALLQSSISALVVRRPASAFAMTCSHRCISDMPFALGVSEASLENEHGVTSAMNVLA